jgi:hypothetical protein
VCVRREGPSPGERPKREPSEGLHLSYTTALDLSLTMRFSLAVTLIAASVSAGSAFAPASKWGVAQKTVLYSTVEASTPVSVQVAVDVVAPVEIEADVREISNEIVPLTADEINARLNAQLEKLSAKDQTSKQLSKEVCGFD